MANIKGFNPLSGGVESVSCVLAEEFVRRGHLVCFMANERFEFQAPIGLKTCVLPNQSDFCSVDNVNAAVRFLSDFNIGFVLNQSANIVAYNEFWKLVKERAGVKLISVYHFQPFSMIYVAAQNFFIRCRNSKNLFSYVRDFFLWLRFHLYKKKRMLKQEGESLNKMAQISDACVFLASSYLHDVKNIVKERSYLQVIPNAVRTREKFVSGQKKRQVVYVARMEFGHKRPDRLLQVWKRIQPQFPDWELLLIGDGGARAYLQNYVEEQKIDHVRFLGWQYPMPFLEQASVLALTSTSEGWGQVLVEAQQNACVPISFDSFGAARDIIDDGISGILVKPFDLKEYAEKLKMIMRNDGLRKRMAISAQESSRRFEVSRIADMWEKLFSRLLVCKSQ